MRRVTLWLLVLVSFAGAQEVSRFSAGFGELVTGAWNPVVLHGRDLAGYTLRIDIELGTLREQARFETHEFQFPAGRGNMVLEEAVYVPPEARTLAWRVHTAERTVQSGQLDVSLSGNLPVVLLVGVAPAGYPSQLRTERVAAHDLSPEPAMYDGVAAIVLSGSGVAPSLEAITAAAAMGATVLLPPAHDLSFAAVSRLADAARDGLGAGTVLVSEPTANVLQTAVAAWQQRSEAVAAMLSRTPELPALPLAGYALLLAVVAYVLLARAVSYVRGTPGIASVLLLVGVTSAAVIIGMQGTNATTDTSYLVASGGGLQRIDEVHVVHERGGHVQRTYFPPRVERAP